MMNSHNPILDIKIHGDPAEGLNQGHSHKLLGGRAAQSQTEISQSDRQAPVPAEPLAQDDLVRQRTGADVPNHECAPGKVVEQQTARAAPNPTMATSRMAPPNRINLRALKRRTNRRPIGCTRIVASAMPLVVSARVQPIP